MADSNGNNEGVRVLEEFVCQAIPDPSFLNPENETALESGGVNQRLQLLEEASCESAPLEQTQTPRLKEERLIRLLAFAIVHDRAVELAKPLPITLGEIDLGERGNEVLGNTLALYFRSRTADLARRSEDLLLHDIAQLMVDLARPNHVFRAAARETGIHVGSRLLRYEGWRAVPGAFPEWVARTAAVDPLTADATTTYLRFLRRYWEWSGKYPATDAEEAQLVQGVSIPESVLSDLAGRCA